MSSYFFSQLYLGRVINVTYCTLLILTVRLSNKNVCHILSLSQILKLKPFIPTNNATLEICRGRLSLLLSIHYPFMRRYDGLFPIEQEFDTCIFFFA